MNNCYLTIDRKEDEIIVKNNESFEGHVNKSKLHAYLSQSNQLSADLSLALKDSNYEGLVDAPEVEAENNLKPDEAYNFINDMSFAIATNAHLVKENWHHLIAASSHNVGYNIWSVAHRYGLADDDFNFHDFCRPFGTSEKESYMALLVLLFVALAICLVVWVANFIM